MAHFQFSFWPSPTMLPVENATFGFASPNIRTFRFFLNSPRNVGTVCFLWKCPYVYVSNVAPMASGRPFHPVTEPCYFFGFFPGKFFVTKIEVLAKPFNGNSELTSKFELQYKRSATFQEFILKFHPSGKYSVWFGISNPLQGLSISQTSELVVCSGKKRSGKTRS